MSDDAEFYRELDALASPAAPAPVRASGRTYNPAGVLPEELTTVDRWIVWKYLAKANGGKPTKFPCTPEGGSLDGWQSDPSRWMSHEAAVAAYERNPALAGIGFVLTADLGIVGVDMDHVIDSDTGEIAEWAQEHVRDLDSYTEVSPSGRGFRTFLLGTLPDGCPHKAGHREIYDRGRWLTITGNVWHDAPIVARPAAVERYIAAMRKPRDASAADVHTGASSGIASNAAMIRSVLAGDNLHDSTRDLAFRLVDDGLAPAKVVEIVRGVMDAMPDRGDAGRWRERYADIPRLVAGAVVKMAPSAAAPSGWRLDRVGTLLEQPAPTRWLVRGVLEQDSLACLFGASGSGKSFVAVDLAASIATGALWHAHAVAQGAVVYMAGEGHHGLRKRFLAWSREHAIDLAAAPLFVSSAAIDVSGSHTHVVAAIKQQCDRPALVIIDTLHRHLPPGGDDSATTDMGALVAGADAIREALGCAVLLVHHTGHAASDRERGSSVLRGALDWSYSLQKGDAGPLIFQCRKAKDHELPEPMQFALHSVELPWLDDEGEHEVSAVLRTTGTTEAGMGGNQLLAMTKLRRMTYEAKGEPVTVKDWRNESGADRRRWREVVASLVERGQIFIEGDHVRLLEPAT